MFNVPSLKSLLYQRLWRCGGLKTHPTAVLFFFRQPEIIFALLFFVVEKLLRLDFIKARHDSSFLRRFVMTFPLHGKCFQAA